MFSKFSTLALVLLIGAAPPQRARDLEGLLPPPTWIVAHADQLGLDPHEIERFRQHVESTRRPLTELRREARRHRKALTRALSQDTFDRVEIETHFEALLATEDQYKRDALSARLDFLDSITPEKRRNVRLGAGLAAEQRRELRQQIERIRGLFQRTTIDPDERDLFRKRMRRLETLVRRGEFGRALHHSEYLLDELTR